MFLTHGSTQPPKHTQRKHGLGSGKSGLAHKITHTVNCGSVFLFKVIARYSFTSACIISKHVFNTKTCTHTSTTWRVSQNLIMLASIRGKKQSAMFISSLLSIIQEVWEKAFKMQAMLVTKKNAEQYLSSKMEGQQRPH